MAKAVPTQVAAKDPWQVAEENRGILVDWVRRFMPWACRRPDLYEDVIQSGMILMYRAAVDFDPSRTTYAGRAISFLDAQLLHRVREQQGLSGLPPGSFSMDDAARHEAGTGPKEEYPDLRAHSTPESRKAFGEALREAVAGLLDAPGLRLYGLRARRMVLRAVMVRAWGNRDTRESATERAERFGCRREELEAIEQRWRERHGRG